MKILLVEDEPRLRAPLRAGLTEAGYVVEEADNGRDAQHLGAPSTWASRSRSMPWCWTWGCPCWTG